MATIPNTCVPSAFEGARLIMVPFTTSNVGRPCYTICHQPRSSLRVYRT
jgi:hypothetical protein